MSAGVVPATNAVSAITEFADASCAILADDEDHIGLANGILNMYNNPKTFSQMSNNAGKRVRKQTAAHITISKELNLRSKSSVSDIILSMTLSSIIKGEQIRGSATQTRGLNLDGQTDYDPDNKGIKEIIRADDEDFFL